MRRAMSCVQCPDVLVAVIAEPERSLTWWAKKQLVDRNYIHFVRRFFVGFGFFFQSG